ncbi:hypothetical protein [Flavobacterium sp. LHD-85]|uniref:hypothetical protein n=1 Tax=Flavobacterium sp. LHD-85 TaxID=3071410 RepID=UPI0035A975D2
MSYFLYLQNGTVGGGTSFPTQKECLELMGFLGSGKSDKFADIAVCLCLCEEISLMAATSAGQFYSSTSKKWKIIELYFYY